MGIVLPIAVLLLLWRFFWRCGDSSREALLRACVFSGTLLVAITEFLSMPRLLTREALLIAWLLALLGVGLLLYRRVSNSSSVVAGPLNEQRFHGSRGLSALQWSLVGMIVASLSLVGVVAIAAPPNSWDAMEHILPRIVFWVSNHSVKVYPTPDYAQLLKGEGTEFLMLHSYLLWGSDRLVNLIEFFSLVGVAIGASLIASKLGAQRTGQLIAALFAVTVPEAVLESSGSMTTTVVSFWIVTACYFVLQAGERLKTRDIAAAGLAAGLAVLTQPIVFPCLPAVLLGCLLFRPMKTWAWALRRLPLFVVLLVAVDAGQMARNRQVTGTLLGHPFAEGGPRLDFTNPRITPARVVANVLRQASLQMGTPSSKLNARIEKIVRRAIHAIGQDPDDRDASWSGLPYLISPPGRLETLAGNPVQFLLITICFVAAFFLKTRLRDQRLLWYTGGIVCAFIVFSAVIRWQPWGSRFHLPLFMLAAAVVGVIVERLLSRSWLVLVFALFLLMAAAPYLLSNSARSIVAMKGFPTVFLPRPLLYFGDQHLALAPRYTAMSNAIRAHACRRVAIDAYLPVPEPHIAMSPRSFFVYPLLAEIGIDGQTSSVRYIGVENPTRNFAPSTAAQDDCAVICLTCRLSNGAKSDAAMGETLIFDDSELVFPARSK